MGDMPSYALTAYTQQLTGVAILIATLGLAPGHVILLWNCGDISAVA